MGDGEVAKYREKDWIRKTFTSTPDSVSDNLRLDVVINASHLLLTDSRGSAGWDHLHLFC